MTMDREILFDYLQEIYGNKTYDLDKDDQLKKLRRKGWIFEQDGKEIKKPDFLCFKSKKRILLIELKKIEEKESDLEIKKGLKRAKEGIPFGWWVGSNRKNLKTHVNRANKQFHEFIKFNISQFLDRDNKLISNFSTILALYSKRIMQRYTLPDIFEVLYGKVTQVYENDFYSFHYKIEDKLLNIKRY